MCFEKVVNWDEWSNTDVKFKNAYDLYKRKEYFREFYYYYEDITRVVRGYPRVHFRHLITPKQDVGGGYVPLFDGIDVTRQFLKQGYEDAEQHLNYYFMRHPEESAEFSQHLPDGWEETHRRVKSSRQEAKKSTMNLLSFEAIRERIATEEEKAN